MIILRIEIPSDFGFMSRSNFKLDFLFWLWLLPEKKRVENWKLLCLKVSFYSHSHDDNRLLEKRDRGWHNHHLHWLSHDECFCTPPELSSGTHLAEYFSRIRNMQFTTPYLIIKGKKHINWWLSNFHCIKSREKHSSIITFYTTNIEIIFP